MAVQDVRSHMPGGYSKRSISQVKNIARHHSATTDGDAFSFADYHINHHGWKTSGYHEVILPDGTVQHAYDDNVVTNGIGGHNTPTYHICVVGNGSFTDAQEKAFEEQAKKAMKRFNLSANDVLGHNEFSGTNTSCPGINMNGVRDRLSNSPKLKVDGYLGPNTISALQRHFGTVVDGYISEPSLLVKAMQKWLGTPQDGIISEPSLMVKALQRKLGTPQDGIISRPSLVVKELQRRLNKGTL